MVKTVVGGMLIVMNVAIWAQQTQRRCDIFPAQNNRPEMSEHYGNNGQREQGRTEQRSEQAAETANTSFTETKGRHLIAGSSPHNGVATLLRGRYLIAGSGRHRIAGSSPQNGVATS